MRSIFEHLSDAELGKVAEEMAVVYERIMAPSTQQVIAKMIHYGCPRHAAEMQMRQPGLALYARQFYIDAEDAEHGEPIAKERLERVCEAWGRQNAAMSKRAEGL